MRMRPRFNPCGPARSLLDDRGIGRGLVLGDQRLRLLNRAARNATSSRPSHNVRDTAPSDLSTNFLRACEDREPRDRTAAARQSRFGAHEGRHAPNRSSLSTRCAHGGGRRGVRTQHVDDRGIERGHARITALSCRARPSRQITAARVLIVDRCSTINPDRTTDCRCRSSPAVRTDLIGRLRIDHGSLRTNKSSF
jgi:hypothetical protein